MFCKECGSEINDKAVLCVKCGVETKESSMTEGVPKGTDIAIGIGIIGKFLLIIAVLLLVWGMLLANYNKKLSSSDTKNHNIRSTHILPLGQFNKKLFIASAICGIIGFAGLNTVRLSSPEHYLVRKYSMRKIFKTPDNYSGSSQASYVLAIIAFIALCSEAQLWFTYLICVFTIILALMGLEDIKNNKFQEGKGGAKIGLICGSLIFIIASITYLFR